ncbi:MAG TPA: CHAT domain-containing protein [Pyrinomonadaceae bacterium]|nr:CHAT domain-containing protein [Pyrinomonadaceae bacterium]
MQPKRLAKLLIDATAADERATLLAKHVKLANGALAVEIREACIAAWSADPTRVRQCVEAANALEKIDKTAETRANGNWTRGIAAITQGRFANAVNALTKANRAFAKLELRVEQARVNVAKLLALAMKGDYDEAIAAGERALPVLVESRDHLGAGKIEMNLSNIVSRRSQHEEAIKYCTSARRRFIKAKAADWQAMAENGLANSYAELNNFPLATRYYAQAMATAKSAKMHVTVAEIEASMGNLALLRGQYAEALRDLELSRRKFDALAMPHQSAIADLEIADIYRELNLTKESSEIYERIIPQFSNLEMRAEEARATHGLGVVQLELGRSVEGVKALRSSERLFRAERNPAAAIRSHLERAAGLLSIAKPSIAISETEKILEHLDRRVSPRTAANVELIRGAAYLAVGNSRQAIAAAHRGLDDAKRFGQRSAELRSHNLLGRCHLVENDRKKAEAEFKRAIRVIETLRAPLASEQFSVAYMASQIEPYEQLSRLYINEGKALKAFQMVENSRSRFLGDVVLERKAARNDEAATLREQLNSAYQRLARGDGNALELNTAISNFESEISKIDREQASTKLGHGRSIEFNIAELRRALGGERTLIEYVNLGGNISAFVVSGKGIRLFKNIATTDQIAELADAFRFQIDAMRYSDSLSPQIVSVLKRRTDGILERLYENLLSPFAEKIRSRNVVFVTGGILSSLPFQAFRNAGKYLIESHEINYSPSAKVWLQLQRKRSKAISNSLLVGFADEKIPFVENEVRSVKKFAPQPTSLLGKTATFDSFRNLAANVDLIHMACHGMFRSDNAMFSSLHLADGWITARDISAMRLRAELVVLSACETASNETVAGDELLGLARGFLMAGARSLVVSLWNVNDAATRRLMESFYAQIQLRDGAAASLRKAQISAIERGEHPYFWAPFVAIGK